MRRAQIIEEMRNLKIAFLFLIVFSFKGFSQQDPLSSHYMFNTLSFNPGSTGVSGMICATAINRQQWVGFEGAPATTYFNVSAPINLFRINSGVGLIVTSDKAGFDKDISLSGSYAYHLELGTGELGIGINLGMINKALDPTWVIPSGDSHTPPSGDPLIPENKESYVAFDAGLGVFYRTDKYYAGLSVTHINEPEIKYTKGLPYVSRHYYLVAGYTLQLPNPAFELIPSIFAFSDGKVAQVAVNALVRYNNKFWGGVSYRVQDAVVILLGMNYKNFRIGYAYDITTSRLASAGSSGSHEIMLGYCFKIVIEKPRKSYRNTRFL